MFAKIFRRCKEDSSSVSSSSKLQQAFEKLEKKEIILQEKIAVEIERAKEFTKAKNRPAALQCLVRKKFYEEQIEHLGSFQMLIHDKEQMLQKKSSVNGSQLQRITRNVNRNFENNNIRATLHATLNSS
ncbi:vacuolar protein sorting-associated protein 32 homolog 1-like [Phalaenopsis equestris]|uniref:vacuolar protein sorting-associated protein 32 homolog 1-like n=1 Tax=Phalaenopsis equestris TaxID=78828 RepID=UPI0009E649FD|nr:vacuolar protein sorting-associated protein 32 homolog 1-like [Phalaenopsis equestris]